jgi:hypothetical protein
MVRFWISYCWFKRLVASHFTSPRPEVVRHRLVRDVFTDPSSDFASRAKMNAAPDAGKPHFDGGVGEALIRRRYAGQSRRTQCEGCLVTQKQRQHAHGRASNGGMGRDVFRMIRRGDQRSPQGVRFGGGVAIGIGQPNRVERTPETVMVLGVETGNHSVARREVD